MCVEVGKPTTFVDLSVKARGGERYIIEWADIGSPLTVGSMRASKSLMMARFFMRRDFMPRLLCEFFYFALQGSSFSLTPLNLLLFS